MAVIHLSVVSTPRHQGPQQDSDPAGTQGPWWTGPARARSKLWMGGSISELAHLSPSFCGATYLQTPGLPNLL